MEVIESNAIQMELKYCERCGGLWLRPRGSELIYCPPCSVVLAGVGQGRRFLEHRGAPRARNNASCVETTFWGEGGRA